MCMSCQLFVCVVTVARSLFTITLSVLFHVEKLKAKRASSLLIECWEKAWSILAGKYSKVYMMTATLVFKLQTTHASLL